MIKITPQVFGHLDDWTQQYNPSDFPAQRLRTLMLDYLRSLPDDEAEHLINEGWPRVYEVMPKPDKNEKIKALIIRTDGSEETVEVLRAHPFKELYVLLGCDTFDTVTLPPKEEGDAVRRVMLVDDNGYETRAEHRGNVTTLVPTNARKPVNEKATELYQATVRKRGGVTSHQIVGDVAIVNDDDFD